jgi:hypothetical protein
MSDRTPRSNDSRDKAERKKSWQRPTMLPDPEPREGVSYRWVRTSTLGQNDNTNVSSKFREGWTQNYKCCLISIPDLKVMLRLEDCYFARTQPNMSKAVEMPILR